jgi:hypothetical protein
MNKKKEILIQKVKDLLENSNFQVYVSKWEAYTRYKNKDTKLNSIEDLINLLNNTDFTFEDFFYDRLDDINLNEEESIYWENNMEKFEYQNFIIPEHKDIESGKWIKIRNSTGYEIHYAKKSRRKLRFAEKIHEVSKKLNTHLSKLELEFDEDKMKIGVKKANKLKQELLKYQVYFKIGLVPYEVYYYKTKSTKEYLMPFQYEIIDIEEHIQCVIDGVDQVELISLFDSRNDNEIFYLMSRGLSKVHAAILSNLKNCYFRVNMIEAIQAYDAHLKSRIKLVTN